MADIALGAPISTRDGFTVQIEGFDVGSRRGYRVEFIGQSSGANPTIKGGIPDENGLITVQNLEPGETTKIRVTLSGDSGTSATGTPLPGDALVPLLEDPFVPTADGCTVRIKNMDNRWKFVGTGNNILAELSMGVVVVKDKQPGQPITVTVTSKKLGHADGTSSVIGFASPLVPTFDPPKPTNTTSFTVQITNYKSAYTWTPTATLGTVAINGTGLITVTDLAVPGTESTVTVTTSRGDAPNVYAPGTATVKGNSMDPTMRWIHVGLSAPDPTDPSSNNNDIRNKYVLNTWGNQKEYPKYEVENISHLTPKEMKAAYIAASNIKSKDVLIGENDLLNVNEIELKSEDAPTFRYYWSQQPNRKIIDSVSSTSIKMNGQNETNIDLNPTDILTFLFSDLSDGAHNNISHWNNQNSIRGNLLTTEDGSTSFIPSQDGKIPIPSWKLKQALQSGNFTGKLVLDTTKKIVGNSNYLSKSSAWIPAVTKKNTIKLLQYPIDITVTVMLEYTINAEVRSYKDFTRVASKNERNLKLPRYDSTHYILKRRVPISMVIPYNMTRTFTDTAPKTVADLRSALTTSICQLSIATELGRVDGSMENFRTHLLKNIPSLIQYDIDEFLKTGPFYYPSFGKKQKGEEDGRNIIDWKSRTSYIPEQFEPEEGKTPHQTANNKRSSRIPLPLLTYVQVAAIEADDGEELKPAGSKFNGCYEYITYNIDLNSIQAATSNIFISSISLAHINESQEGGAHQDNPIVISFYNDLDTDMRAPSTALSLELGVVDGYGVIDAKDLIPQFYDHINTKIIGGVHTLVSGVGDTKSEPIAGWVVK